MALKAGRVGVAPDQVDEFGKINSETTEGYTKQEADAKFETQIHAASTYETKSEAAALQPKTLAVPIEMLDGTKLTVESALEGLNTQKEDKATFTIDSWQDTTSKVIVKKYGRIVMVDFVSTTSFSLSENDVICTIPERFRPEYDISFLESFGGKRLLVASNGNITAKATINDFIRGIVTYIGR